MMKTPSFWYDARGLGLLYSLLLIPISWIYALLFVLNKAFNTAYKPQTPVIVIGNYTAGGSGKTPTAITLFEHLKQTSGARQPVFLCKGYGGAIKSPTLIDNKIHTAQDCGDEALLLSNYGPTIIADNRLDGIKFCEAQSYDLIIMDDGLQNPKFKATINILIIDAVMGFGNGRLIPAGPLRQSPDFKDIDAVICIGGIPDIKIPGHITLFKAQGHADIKSIDKSKRYLAFTGLAYPEKFKTTLLDNDLDLADWAPFPDHYNYTDGDLAALRAGAKKLKARLITTEKDYMRLSGTQRAKSDIDVVKWSIAIDDVNSLTSLLKAKGDAS